MDPFELGIITLLQLQQEQITIQEFDSILNTIKLQDDKQLSQKFVESFINILNNKLKIFKICYIGAHIISAFFVKKLFFIDKISLNSLITFLNLVVKYLDILEGLEITYTLGIFCSHTLHYLLEQKNIDQENKEQLLLLKQHPVIKGTKVVEEFQKSYNEIDQLCQSENIDKKIQAINRLFDVFTECLNYQEQLYFFSRHITELLKKILSGISLNKTQELEKTQKLLILLSKLLLTILIKTEYCIEFSLKKLKSLRDINQNSNSLEYMILTKEIMYPEEISGDKIKEKKQESNNNINNQSGSNVSSNNNQIFESDNVILRYRLNNLEENLKGCKEIYKNVALIVNTMLLFPIHKEIQRYCLLALETLYQNFLEFRKHIEEPILTVLSNISEHSSSDLEKKIAVIFLFKLINSKDTSEKLIEQLNSRPKIAALKESQYFKEEFANDHSIHNSMFYKFEQLVIRSTFAMSKQVEPERNFQINIEITKPFSIFYIGFATLQNDISVIVSKLMDLRASTDSQIFPRIYFQGKINSEMDPFKIIMIVEQPGIYRIEFDNGYSWYNQKFLRYRICILEPELGESEVRKKLEIFPKPKQHDQNVLADQQQNYYSKDECALNLINNFQKLKINGQEIKTLLLFQQSDFVFKCMIEQKLYQIQIQAEYEIEESFKKLNQSLSELFQKNIQIPLNQYVNYCMIIYNQNAFSQMRKGQIQRQKQKNYYEQSLERLLTADLPIFQQFGKSIFTLACEITAFHEIYLQKKLTELSIQQGVIVIRLSLKKNYFYSKIYINGKQHPYPDFSDLLANTQQQSYKTLFCQDKSQDSKIRQLHQFLLNTLLYLQNIQYILIWESKDDAVFNQEEQLSQLKEFILQKLEKSKIQIPAIENVSQEIDEIKDIF